MWRLIREMGQRVAAFVNTLIRPPAQEDNVFMADSSSLRLISEASALAVESNEIHYLPFGTTTLKLRFDPPANCPAGVLIATPRQRHAESERVVVGHEDNGSDLWITWGGGKAAGIHFDPEKGQRYLYFNLYHRSQTMSQEYQVTIQVKTEQGDLVCTRSFMLVRPFARQPIQLQWQHNWPTGSTLSWQGKQVPAYQSRWWPKQRLAYQTRDIPALTLDYTRLAKDNRWGQVTLSLGEGADKSVLLRIDGRLERALHDNHLFYADLFHFHDNVWAVRIWFNWLHHSFTEDDLASELRNQATPLVRDRREEIPDAERFDVLIDIEEKIVTHIGTDNHYKELWGEWYEDRPVQAYIGHNRSIRTAFFIMSTRVTDTFVGLSNERTDSYNPSAVIYQEMTHPQRALGLQEIMEALSWEAHPPLVDDFRVPSDLIGPDVRMISD